MDISLWWAIVVIAVGTFAMRLVPLLWMRKHLKKHSDKDAMEVTPQWLTLLAPLMIAAMLGVTLVPKNSDFNSWAAVVTGSLVTLFTWKYSRSLGLPVFVGVLAFGLTSIVL